MAVIFSLDIRRAKKGDCLLLHWGEADDPGLIVIDGGPGSVYRPHLKTRIKDIRQARGLADADRLLIDAVVVSHVDDDHIHGVLDLMSDLVKASNEHRPAIANVLGCWHNTFDDIIGNTPDELRASITAQFGAAALDGELPQDDGIEPDATKILASVGQGHRLRDDARRLEIPINPEFQNKLIMAEAGAAKIDGGRGLEFTIVGPMRPELAALQKKHDEFLRDNGIGRTSPEAALAAFTDPSVPNLSSIVMLAVVEDKSMLLTGDARGDKILAGLELVGLLPAGGTMHVDVLKVPHHGSDHNMETGFFRDVTADHYVFSGDGEHGNPERKTLEMLFEARGDDPFVMYFTYPIAEIDAGREEDWEKEFNKGRRDRHWSAKTDSITALFASRDLAAAGQEVRFIAENEPFLIDLLEPLGF